MLHNYVENRRNVKLKGAEIHPLPGGILVPLTLQKIGYRVDVFGLAIRIFGFFFSVSSDSGRL